MTMVRPVRHPTVRLLVVVCWLGVLIAIVASCSGYEPTRPASLDDGWATAEPADVGLDQEALGDLVGQVHDNPARMVHSILIVKDGKLAFEEYFDGYRFDYGDPEFKGEAVTFDAGTTHNLMSVTKAVTAALVGIAIDQGAISGVDETVFDALPEYARLRVPSNAPITIEHLLTMTSGLEWNEWDAPITDPGNDLIQLFVVDDPVEYILSKPVTHEPGTYWYYSGGDVNLLGEVIEARVGEPVDTFAAEELFAPLGITEYRWRHLSPDVVYTSGELALRPRDLAKFGYLFLSQGEWGGRQILSPGWVAASIEDHISTRGLAAEGYGYQWFTSTCLHDGTPIEAILRTGWGGQMLALFPDLDLMVVLTGGDYVLETDAFQLVTDYILPAVR